MTRRRQEWVLSLDASELAWSGALDGLAAPDAWPWGDLCERSAHLFSTRHAAEELALEAASVAVLAPDQVDVELSFKVVDSRRPERVGGTWSQTLSMEGTSCPFGGLRWWFRCPVVCCGKRRASLYRPGFGPWACRECNQLTYTSRGRYSARTSRSNGWGSFNQFLDRDHSRYERRTRANLRRGLSRWRGKARQDERRTAWPVQVTCHAGPARPSVSPSPGQLSAR